MLAGQLAGCQLYSAVQVMAVMLWHRYLSIYFPGANAK